MPSPVKGRIPAATVELAKMLFLQGLSYAAVAEQTGLKRLTLETMASRKGWTSLKRQLATIPPPQNKGSVPVVISRPPSIDSTEVRTLLAKELLQQLQVLAETPAKRPGDLGNTRERQGRAAVVELIARSAATVFPDWEQSSTGIIVLGELVGTRESVPAIDIGTAPPQVVVAPETPAALPASNQDNSAPEPKKAAEQLDLSALSPVSAD